MDFPTTEQKSYLRVHCSVVFVFLCSQTYRHNSEKTCYCYKCRLVDLLKCLLIDLLRYRGHLPLICVIANDNYLRSDKYIVDFFKKIKDHLV